jgi:signal transduction histidine kinase
MSSGRAVVGKTMREALPELEAQGLFDVVERVRTTGGPFTGTEIPVIVRMGKDGERAAYINGTYQPLRGPRGEVEGIMAFAYEVTDLVVSRQRVEAAVKVRDDFLSVAGHELRTPITALGLQIQSLQRLVARNPDPEPVRPIAERLARAHANLLRLDRLVGDLLDVSRITSGHLAITPEPVDLSVLAAEIVERFSDEAARVGCAGTLDAAPGVAGVWDRGRLDQVITNLIGNALKYAAGTPVRVRVSSGAGRAVLEVADGGIGIAEDDQRRIFERFERAAPHKAYGGLGLGLWITRQIVVALGGTIRLDSRVGEGSTFTVELPTSGAA